MLKQKCSNLMDSKFANYKSLHISTLFGGDRGRTADLSTHERRDVVSIRKHDHHRPTSGIERQVGHMPTTNPKDGSCKNTFRGKKQRVPRALQ